MGEVVPLSDNPGTAELEAYRPNPVSRSLLLRSLRKAPGLDRIRPQRDRPSPARAMSGPTAGPRRAGCPAGDNRRPRDDQIIGRTLIDMSKASERRRAGGTAKSVSAARREREGEMHRTLMVDAALELFASKGYFGATVEQISARAGFSRSAVYLHYPNGKTDLYAAALIRAVDQRHAAVVTSVNSSAGMGTEERIARLWAALWAFRIEHGEYLKVLSLVSFDDLRLIIPEGKMGTITSDSTKTYVAIGEMLTDRRVRPVTEREELRYGRIFWAYFLGLSQFVNAQRHTGVEDSDDEITRRGLSVVARGFLGEVQRDGDNDGDDVFAAEGEATSDDLSVTESRGAVTDPPA
jgi:AcrR family transcriptional regulator